MKKILVLTILGVSICMAGCSKSTKEDSSADSSTIVIETSTPSPSPSPTPVAVVKAESITQLQALGTKSATTTEVLLKNSTGKELTEFYAKDHDSEEWGSNLLNTNGKIKTDEEVHVYVEAAVSTYDLKASYLDENNETQTIELDNIDVSDIDFTEKQNIQFCLENGTAYAIYRSLNTKAQVNTKDIAATETTDSTDASSTSEDSEEDYYDSNYYDDSSDYSDDSDYYDDYDESEDYSENQDYEEDDDSGSDGFDSYYGG